MLQYLTLFLNVYTQLKIVFGLAEDGTEKELITLICLDNKKGGKYE